MLAGVVVEKSACVSLSKSPNQFILLLGFLQ